MRRCEPTGSASTPSTSAGVVAGFSTEGAWVYRNGRFTLLRGRSYAVRWICT